MYGQTTRARVSFHGDEENIWIHKEIKTRKRKSHYEMIHNLQSLIVLVQPIPVAVRFCDHSIAGNAGSNPAEGTDVWLL
jgi:hypothetical protein